MDTITHIVLGASLGEAIAGKKMGKRAMLWGALAANVPDLDVFYSSFQNIPDSLLAHRGFAHSILFAVIVIPLLAFGFNFLFRKKKYGVKMWLLIFAAGIFSHILIDSLTNYGTGWFEPFSHYRVSFNTIFVLDPFYTIALLISFVALLILKSSSRIRKYFLFGGLIISSVYLLFTFINKFSMNAIFEKSLREKNIPFSAFITTPVPLNNFLWYDIAMSDGGYYIGYRSLFDRSALMNLTFVPKNDSLLGDLKRDRGVAKLIRFSQDYYCVTKNDSGGVNFYDMRFGQLGGWDDPHAPFVFSFHIAADKNGAAIIRQGKFGGIKGDDFKSLVRRIEGGD